MTDRLAEVDGNIARLLAERIKLYADSYVDRVTAGLPGWWGRDDTAAMMTYTEELGREVGAEVAALVLRRSRLAAVALSATPAA